MKFFSSVRREIRVECAFCVSLLGQNADEILSLKSIIIILRVTRFPQISPTLSLSELYFRTSFASRSPLWVAKKGHRKKVPVRLQTVDDYEDDAADNEEDSGKWC